MKPRLAIILPSYNEERRLPRTLTSLRREAGQDSFPWTLMQVLVMDDGSKDKTRDVVESLMPTWPELQVRSFCRNHGKGAAVWMGLRLSAQVDFVLVADADEATPWGELYPLAQVVLQDPDSFLYYGSRRHPRSQILKRQKWWRESMGQTFNLILRGLSGVATRDTQCGFKLFRKGSKLETLLAEWTVARFAWDAEVFLTAARRGFSVTEFPVQWRHVEESRVHPLRDSLQMIFEMIRLRLRHCVKDRPLSRRRNHQFVQTPFARKLEQDLISNQNR